MKIVKISSLFTYPKKASAFGLFFATDDVIFVMSSVSTDPVLKLRKIEGLKRANKSLYLSLNVFSTAVLIGET